jgi:hypothetical protein
MSLVYFVYGHCRSTTGGYDIWSECDGHKIPIYSESNIRNTTINKMNYLAMTKLLDYLTPPSTHNDDDHSSSSSSSSSLPRLTIVCNCRLMYKQLCGLLDSKVLKEEYGKTIKLLNELKTTNQVNLISCDAIYPPSVFK